MQLIGGRATLLGPHTCFALASMCESAAKIDMNLVLPSVQVFFDMLLAAGVSHLYHSIAQIGPPCACYVVPSLVFFPCLLQHVGPGRCLYPG